MRVLLLLVLAAGAALAEQPESTRKMAALLSELAKGYETDPSISENKERVARTRGLVKQGKTLDARERLEFGVELLRAGEPAEALSVFESLGTSAPCSPQELRLHIAMSHLRLGEQQNCIALHGKDSCLFPIRGGGVHTVQAGSRAAIKELEAMLAEYGENLSLRWLLNVAYMTVGEYPQKVPARWLIAPEAFEPEAQVGRFVDVGSDLGISVLGYTGGAISEDFDGDGYIDVIASSKNLRHQLRFFRNNGDGTFSDRSVEAGLKGITDGNNLLQADYDNDGNIDVLVLRGTARGPHGHYPMSLLRNEGGGRFVDVTERAGLMQLAPLMSAGFADFDNDGRLDLYLGNESNCPGHTHPSRLLRGKPDGTFEEVPGAAGAEVTGYIRGMVWGDYDNDGRQDIYVSVRGQPNRLFRNSGPDPAGRWRFEDAARAAGVQHPIFSFHCWFWDFDNDGNEDLFTEGYGFRVREAQPVPKEMLQDFIGLYFSEGSDAAGQVAASYLQRPVNLETPRLMRNKGDGTFEDVTRQAGLGRVLFSMAGNYGDIDNDGYPDIYLGTGAGSYSSLVPNRMFLNSGGKRFLDVTSAAGVGHLQKGHAVCFADMDNDGDQDIYEVMGGGYSGDLARGVTFLNPGAAGRWLRVRLEGVESNRGAIGARLVATVATDAGQRQVHSTVSSGGSFGASSLERHIGLGNARKLLSLQVTWPNARHTTQEFKGLELDRVYRIREGESTPVEVPLKKLDFTAKPPR